MVIIMENPIKMDDLGIPLFFGNTYMKSIKVSEVLMDDIARKRIPAERHAAKQLEGFA